MSESLPVRYEWAIEHKADPRPFTEIKHMPEIEAKDWVFRFPDLYRLMRRISPGPWEASDV